MEAYLSHSPMLVLTDTSDGGFWQLGNNQAVSGEYGTGDLLSILRAMTKYTTLATTPNEAVLGLQLAIKHALSGAPGPAAVLMRTMAAWGDIDPKGTPAVHKTVGHLSATPSVPPLAAIQKTVEALVNAQRPVIIAGNGVHIARAHDQLRALAEMLAVPVATTYKGKSAIEETHPLSVGPMGIYGIETANRVVSEADVVLVVGTRLRPQDTASHHPNLLNPERQRIFQIDIEARNTGWTVPVEMGLVGDAKAVLTEILHVASETPKRPDKDYEDRVLSIADKKKQYKFFEDSPGIHSDKSPVVPQRLVRLVQESVDPSTIITLDAGNNRGWMYHFYQSQRPFTFLNPGGIAGMGWAIPAAVGAKITRPERPVLAVTGDGGFMMTCNALATAVQYNAPVVVVVLNDSGLGMVRENQGANRIASEFPYMDNSKICQALGGWGAHVTSAKDIPVAVREAFKSGKPAVVDVVVDQNEKFGSFRAGISEFARGAGSDYAH
jgi:acetolactate synthase-1/2/3 large subunit